MGCKINLCPNYYRAYELGSIGQCLRGFLNMSPAQLCQLWRRCFLLDMFTLMICIGPYILLRYSTTSIAPQLNAHESKTFPWSPKTYKIKFHSRSTHGLMLEEEKFMFDLATEVCGKSYVQGLDKSWKKDTVPELEAAFRYFVPACVVNVAFLIPAVTFKSNIFCVEMLRLGSVILGQVVACILGTIAAIRLGKAKMCIYNVLPTIPLYSWTYTTMFLHFFATKIIIILATLWIVEVENRRRAMWNKLKLECIKEFQRVDTRYHSKKYFDTVFPGSTSWGPDFMLIGTYFNLHMARFLGRLPPALKRIRKESKSTFQQLFDTLYPKPKMVFKSKWEPNEYQKTLHTGYWPDAKYVKHHLLAKWDQNQQSDNPKKKHKHTDGHSNRKHKSNRNSRFEKRVTIIESGTQKGNVIEKISIFNGVKKSKGDKRKSTGDEKKTESQLFSDSLRTRGPSATNSTKSIPRKQKSKRRKKRRNNPNKTSAREKRPGEIRKFFFHLRTAIAERVAEMMLALQKCCFCAIFANLIKRVRRFNRRLHKKFLQLFTWSRYVHYRTQWFLPGSVERHFWAKRPRDMFFKNIKVVGGKIVPIVDYHLWGKRPKGLWEDVPLRMRKSLQDLNLPDRRGKKTKVKRQSESESKPSNFDRKRINQSQSESTGIESNAEDIENYVQTKPPIKTKRRRRRVTSKDEQNKKWEFMVRHKILDPVGRQPHETTRSYYGRRFLWQLEALNQRAEQRRRRRRKLRCYIKTRFKKRRLKDASRNLHISPFIEVFHAPPSIFIEKDRLLRLRREMLQCQGVFNPSGLPMEDMSESESNVSRFDFQALRKKKFKQKIYQRPGFTYIPNKIVGKDGQWIPDINLESVTQMEPRLLPVPLKWQAKTWAVPRITLQRPSDEFGNLPPVELLFDPVTHPHIDLTHTELKVVFHVESNPRNYFRTYKGDLDKEVYIKKKRLLITEKRDYTFYKDYLKKSSRWRQMPDKYRKLYPGNYWDRILFDQTGDVPNSIFWSKKLGRKLSKLWDLRWGQPVKNINKASDAHHVKKEIQQDTEEDQPIRDIVSRRAVNLFQHHLYKTPMEPSERQEIIDRAPSYTRPKGRPLKRHLKETTKGGRNKRDKKRFRKPMKPFFSMPIELPTSLLTDPPFYFHTSKSAKEADSPEKPVRGKSQILSKFKLMPEHLRQKLEMAKRSIRLRKAQAMKQKSTTNLLSPHQRSYNSLLETPISPQPQPLLKILKNDPALPPPVDSSGDNAPKLTLQEFASRPPEELYRELTFSRFNKRRQSDKPNIPLQLKQEEMLDVPIVPKHSNFTKNVVHGPLFYTKKRQVPEKKVNQPKIKSRENQAPKRRKSNVPISIVNNYRAGRLKTIMVREARRIFVHKLTNFRRRFLTEQRVELIRRGYSLTTILQWQSDYYQDRRKLPGHLHGYKFKYATFN